MTQMSMTCRYMIEDLSELQFSVLNCPQQQQRDGGNVWVEGIFSVDLRAERK